MFGHSNIGASGREPAIRPICRIRPIQSPSNLLFRAFASLREPPSTIGLICHIRPLATRQLREGGFPPHDPPHLDSCHPKSTVELGYKPLNWGENTLRSLPMTVSGRPKPLGILGVLTPFRSQTEIQPNQAGKFLSSTIDLGCLPSSSLSFSLSIVPPSVGKCRLVSPSVGPSPRGIFLSAAGGFPSALVRALFKNTSFAKRTQSGPSGSNTSGGKNWFGIRVYRCPSVVKNTSFAKRTQFLNQTTQTEIRPFFKKSTQINP
jgi:hypothetical protein